jgi:hypothetical protein
MVRSPRSNATLLEQASKEHGPCIVSAMLLSREFAISTGTYYIVPALSSVHLGQVKVAGFNKSHVEVA